jgi:ADP-ribose pyrophosphatase YjhB (NUDIX family)
VFEPRFCPNCGAGLEIQEREGKQRPVCPSCGFVFYVDPKVAVAVIVPWEDGILLGKRAIDPGSGLWSFPSGYVDRGEVVEQAAVRETWEEISVAVAIEGLVGVYSTAGEPVVLVVYAARYLSGQPTAGPEVSQIGVFPPDALPPMAFAHDRTIIQNWKHFRARADAARAVRART